MFAKKGRPLLSRPVNKRNSFRPFRVFDIQRGTRHLQVTGKKGGGGESEDSRDRRNRRVRLLFEQEKREKWMSLNETEQTAGSSQPLYCTLS